jgi:putative hydrolase of the HAD superfamily
MTMKTIKVVMLDVGNTILHLDFPYIAEVMREYGVSTHVQALEKAEARARTEVDRRHVVGTTTDTGRWFFYFRLIFSGVGLASDAESAEAFRKLEARHRVLNLWCRVPPEVPAVLAELKTKYKLGVVSNADGRIRSLLERVGLLHFMDFVVDSGQIGVEKPDPRIFESALRAANSQPDEAVHVGDLLHVDVAGAAACGILAILLDPFDNHCDAQCARIRSISELPHVLSQLTP